MRLITKIGIFILFIVSCIPTGLIYMLGAAAFGKKVVFIVTVHSASELWLVPPIVWVGIALMLTIGLYTIKNFFNSE
jgi:hypothetical protein